MRLRGVESGLRTSPGTSGSRPAPHRGSFHPCRRLGSPSEHRSEHPETEAFAVSISMQALGSRDTGDRRTCGCTLKPNFTNAGNDERVCRPLAAGRRRAWTLGTRAGTAGKRSKPQDLVRGRGPAWMPDMPLRRPGGSRAPCQTLFLGSSAPEGGQTLPAGLARGWGSRLLAFRQRRGRGAIPIPGKARRLREGSVSALQWLVLFGRRTCRIPSGWPLRRGASLSVRYA